MNRHTTFGNVLAPNAGLFFFPSNDYQKDAFTLRWFRHFHALYGINLAQNPHCKLEENSLISQLIHTPYWDISSDATFRAKGNLSTKNPDAIFGLLDHLNALQTLSILLISAVTTLNRAADLRLSTAKASDLHALAEHQQDGTQQDQAKPRYRRRYQPPQPNRLTGTLIKIAAMALDGLLRWPIGVAATLTTHLFDIIKRLTAIVLATLTASVSQVGAEMGYIVLSALGRVPKKVATVRRAASLAAHL